MAHQDPWPVVWARIFPTLSDELPKTTIKKLNLAFGLGAPENVNELFSLLNSKGTFTGSYVAEANCIKLLRTLYIAGCKDIPSVIKLRKFMEVYFPSSMASFDA